VLWFCDAGTTVLSYLSALYCALLSGDRMVRGAVMHWYCCAALANFAVLLEVEWCWFTVFWSVEGC
jgi:hypothetical protein